MQLHNTTQQEVKTTQKLKYAETQEQKHAIYAHILHPHLFTRSRIHLYVYLHIYFEKVPSSASRATRWNSELPSAGEFRVFSSKKKVVTIFNKLGKRGERELSRLYTQRFAHYDSESAKNELPTCFAVSAIKTSFLSKYSLSDTETAFTHSGHHTQSNGTSFIEYCDNFFF